MGTDVTRRTHIVGVPGALSAPRQEPVPEGLTSAFADVLKDAGKKIFANVSAGRSAEITRVMTEAIKADLPGAATKVIPYGKAILTVLKLSQAFAEGVGKGLDEANARLRLTYDKPILLGDGLSDDDIKTLQYMRAWQANSVSNLNGILFEGVEGFLEGAFDQLKDFLGDKLSDAWKDGVKDYAKELLAENELVGMAARDVADGVAEGRRKPLFAAFQLAATGCVKQWGGESMAKDLEPLLKGSKEDIDVAIISGLVRSMSNLSWDGYQRVVPVGYLLNDLKGAIAAQAAEVCERLKKKYVLKSGDGDEVKVESRLLGKTEVAIPGLLFTQILGGALFSDDYWRAEQTLEAYAQAQAGRLRLLQRNYQWKIDRSSQARALEVYQDLQGKLSDEQQQVNQTAHQMLGQFRGSGQFNENQMSGLDLALNQIPGYASDGGLNSNTRLDLHDKAG